jgi:predicted transposase/invertase (TIGR01784 family)
MMAILMNPKLVSKRNYVLRKIFHSPNSLSILQDLIESFLAIQIQEIQINSYLSKQAKHLPSEENFGIVDVRIQTKDKQEKNIGIQILEGKYITTKLLMYYAQIHCYQLEHPTNQKIVKTITLNFMDENYDNEYRYHQKLILRREKEQEIPDEEMEFHVIELPKFQSIGLERMTRKEEWMTYLKGENEEEIKRVKKTNDKIHQLDQLVDEYWRKEKMK